MILLPVDTSLVHTLTLMWRRRFGPVDWACGGWVWRVVTLALTRSTISVFSLCLALYIGNLVALYIGTISSTMFPSANDIAAAVVALGHKCARWS